GDGDPAGHGATDEGHAATEACDDPKTSRRASRERTIRRYNGTRPVYRAQIDRRSDNGIEIRDLVEVAGEPSGWSLNSSRDDVRHAGDRAGRFGGRPRRRGEHEDDDNSSCGDTTRATDACSPRPRHT